MSAAPNSDGKKPNPLLRRIEKIEASLAQLRREALREPTRTELIGLAEAVKLLDRRVRALEEAPMRRTKSTN